MSSAKDRRLVVAAFAKRAAAETPLTSVSAVPGAPVPAVAGKKPITKGKKISAVPQIHTASFDGLVGDLSAHLEKIGAGWAPKKPHEPFAAKPVTPAPKAVGAGWVPPKLHDPVKVKPKVPILPKAAARNMVAGALLIDMLDKASMCGAKKSKKSTKAPNAQDAGDKSKQQPTKPGIVDLATAADTAPKKADEKKPEPKESENEVKKAAIDMPGITPPPGQMSAPGAPDMPQPDAPPGGGGINMDAILKQLGGGLETIGSKSMSGVGSVLGGLGMPGAKEQLGMWSKDPSVSKGVGTGVSALSAILLAYLIKRLMASGGGGEQGMEQFAGLRCQDLIKKAIPIPGLVAPLAKTLMGGASGGAAGTAAGAAAGGAAAGAAGGAPSLPGIAPAPTPPVAKPVTPGPAQAVGQQRAQAAAAPTPAPAPTPIPAPPTQPQGLKGVSPANQSWARSMFM